MSNNIHERELFVGLVISAIIGFALILGGWIFHLAFLALVGIVMKFTVFVLLFALLWRRTK